MCGVIEAKAWLSNGSIVSHPRVDGIEGVLSVYERRSAALPLDLCNRVHRERRLAAALRPEHLPQRPHPCHFGT